MKQTQNALPGHTNSQNPVVALLEQITHAANAAIQLRNLLTTAENPDCGVRDPR